MTAEGMQELTMDRDRGRAAIVAAAQSGAVSAQDVARLRLVLLSGAGVSRDEADALFALEASGARKCAEWTALFVEAITCHAVWEMRPTGVINESQGEWLIARADAAGTLNALALLVNVLAEAHRVPQWFLAAVRARGAAGWQGVGIALEMAEAELAQAA